MVEEFDTQIDLHEVPDTPARTTQPEHTMPDRSPGAASQMSGTTAISSFSMVEAEFLVPKYILKHMRKLCDTAEEFLEHLAPEDGSVQDDLKHTIEIQRPDADYTEEYRDFDAELKVHLAHYKSDEHNYIHVRSVRHAIFGSDRDVTTDRSGLDLILYLANLLILAKSMIHSDRNDKDMWDALRQLDVTFPSQFMSSLTESGTATTATETAANSELLSDTFKLALDLRTQLAILVLQKVTENSDSDPDEILGEVFFRTEPSQEAEGPAIRGWSVLALGGDDSALPRQFHKDVVKRLTDMRKCFPKDDQSLEAGKVVHLEKLVADFPWQATILRLLHWVRLRHRELHAAIDGLGGASAILRNVKQEIAEPQPVEQPREASNARDLPRQKRTSFGRDRRRSSKKFDPNAPVDVRTIDALKARERLSEGDASRLLQEGQVAPPLEEVQDEAPALEVEHQEPQPVLGDGEPPVVEQHEENVEEPLEDQVSDREELVGPPTSSLGVLKAIKAVSKLEKENRSRSIFDRQSTAQRVDFGDGFETQPTAGPSNLVKGKQRAQPSSSRKRARPADLDSDTEDDDVFETIDRTAHAKERRQQAPVHKKVRIDPLSSSLVPTSHQPRRRIDDDADHIPEREQEESISETDAPDMTEEAPPSTYQAQCRLAAQNRNILAAQRDRKPRTAWSEEEEEAFIEYMSMFPGRYAAIKTYDREEGEYVLEERTQVNLKDKARSMAINMIK
jgi:hypothetical protein